MEAKDYNTYLFFARVWLEESIFQSKSLLDSAMILDAPNDHSNVMEFVKRRAFIEHYVLTSTVMARRFLKRLVHHTNKSEKQTINKYLSDTEIAETIRDMREHSDEYFIGRGREQKKMVINIWNRQDLIWHFM